MSTGTNPARCPSVCPASIGCLAAPSGGTGTAPALPTSPVRSQSGPVARGLPAEGTLCHPDGSSPTADGTGGSRRGEEVFLERARGKGHAPRDCGTQRHAAQEPVMDFVASAAWFTPPASPKGAESPYHQRDGAGTSPAAITTETQVGTAKGTQSQEISIFH